MKFTQGTEVYTRDGEKVGTIERIIMNPRTKKLTHVVVEKGFLFTEDKVMPAEWIIRSDADRMVIKQEVEDYDALPPYEETHYVSVDDQEQFDPLEYDATTAAPPAYYYYTPSITLWHYPAYLHPDMDLPVTEKNIPDHTVELKEGTDVFSNDGKHVGDVDRIFFDTGTNRATHFLISQGLLFKDHKLVPVYWIDTITDDGVHLFVGSKQLEDLPEYEGDEETA